MRRTGSNEATGHEVDCGYVIGITGFDESKLESRKSHDREAKSGF